MKHALITLTIVLSHTAPAQAIDQQPQGVLASSSGSFVLGSVETGGSGVLTKDLYLLDTKTGQVWFHGCIANGNDGKCSRWGMRPLKVSDGAGGPVFDSVKDAAEARAVVVDQAWGSKLNQSAKK